MDLKIQIMITILVLVSAGKDSIICFPDEWECFSKGVAAEVPGCSCVPFFSCNDPVLEEPIAPENNVTCSDAIEICCYDAIPVPALVEDYEPKCGQMNNSELFPFFHEEKENVALFGQFPWMALVLENEVEYISGGSLIHPRVVLTAAHSIYRKEAKNLTVRLGELDTEVVTEPFTYIDIQVESVVTHPFFQRKNLTHNLALLFLQDSASLRPNVDTICLPKKSDIFDNTSCFISGFGKDLYGVKGVYQTAMKAIKLQGVDHAQCEASLQGTVLGSSFKLHESFMCARSTNGQDVCTGDGGSPLVCPSSSDPTNYVLAGIAAWGIQCGKDNVPSVYTSIINEVPWIQQTITENIGLLEYALS